MHVHRERGRGRDVRQAALQVLHLGEGLARAAEGDRHRGVQVAAVTELLEVLGEEPVLAVVHGGPFVEAGQHLFGEQGGLRVEGRGHGASRVGGGPDGLVGSPAEPGAPIVRVSGVPCMTSPDLRELRNPGRLTSQI